MHHSAVSACCRKIANILQINKKNAELGLSIYMTIVIKCKLEVCDTLPQTAFL